MLIPTNFKSSYFISRLWLTKQDYLETGATLNVQEGQVYEQYEPK